MQRDTPPLQRVRCHRTGRVYYGFGDASGPGFGASFQFTNEIYYEYGQWCTEVTECESSNWQELNNLVKALENIISGYKLAGCEILIKRPKRLFGRGPLSQGSCLNNFYSMHSWHCGGRSRVSQTARHNEPKAKGTRKATDTEVYEHGRWSHRRDETGEDMAATYNQWGLVEQLAITLLCM
jgi:hypothetical protein